MYKIKLQCYDSTEKNTFQIIFIKYLDIFSIMYNFYI